MFCPNCGQNCGEARFCSNCGTRLVRPVSENKNTRKGTADIPCGIYKGVTSSLALYERECVVSNRVGLAKHYETRIPYDKLTSVIYVREASRFSRLLFRWEGNKNTPIPEIRQFGADPTTVTVSQPPDVLFVSSYPVTKIKDISDDTLLYHIYCMLKAIAPKTAVFKAEVLMSNTDQVQMLASQTDASVYYDQYAPHRDLAIEEMCRRTGTAQETAVGLVNWVFDQRQEKLYTAEPFAAIRDLNLVLAEKKRREEKAAEENRKEHDKYMLLRALGRNED